MIRLALQISCTTLTAALLLWTAPSEQCGVTDDQQAKCDDGCGVFCQECDEFFDAEEDTEEGKMNYRKKARSAPRANGQLSGEQTVQATPLRASTCAGS
jgi:hypothetical protein